MQVAHFLVSDVSSPPPNGFRVLEVVGAVGFDTKEGCLRYNE